MQDFLILHFQAPLMSFGGPQVDQIGPTGRFPTLSQVAGLLSNALGYKHGEHDRLQALQDRMSLASVLVREGHELIDYQTVDLGQVHLRNPAWTTLGTTEHRKGGTAARFGTHIRLRRYRADASVITAVTLTPSEVEPSLGDLGRAIQEPARPLFVGRKPCLPSAPIFIGVVRQMASIRRALTSVPLRFPEWWKFATADTKSDRLLGEWPILDEASLSPLQRVGTYRVTDQRDWLNRIHVGERVVISGRLDMQLAPAEASQ